MMPMRPEIERRVRSELVWFRLPWSAMVLATLVFAAFGLLVPEAPATPESRVSPLTTFLIIAAAGNGALIFVLDRKLLAPQAMATRVPRHDVEFARRYLLAGHLVLWSLAEILPILGFAQLLLGGRSGIHLLLCGLSVGILAYLMPTSARIAARIAPILR